MRHKQQSLFKPLGSNKNPLNFSSNKDNLIKIPITASNKLCVNTIVKEFWKEVFTSRFFQNTNIN